MPENEKSTDSYQIALVDDDALFLENLSSQVQQILQQAEVPHTLHAFAAAPQLLLTMENGFQYDLFLLDIMMGDWNGLALAQQIRGMGISAPIVFITSTKEYALDGYRVQALHYLLKPVDPPALQELLLKTCRMKQEAHARALTIQHNRDYRKIPLEDIEYIEQVGRKAVIHTFSEQFQSSDSLSHVAAGLPAEMFVRCHQGYAVNLQHIMLLHGPNLETRSGQLLPISRSRSKELKKAFLQRMHSM